jgi:ATPase subunit of ABC transporter with duplicated ATPase domains
MGGVSWSTHKQLQDKSKRQENQITDLEKENEELKRRYEERLKEVQIQKELKEKQEREIQNKKIAALEDMTNSLKKIEEQELEAAEKELNNISIQWCVEEIKEIDLEKILKNCYETLIKFENLEITIKENVKQLIKELIKKNEIKHLNLQVIGKTGVGKSTLLNAIFGENVAEEKKGEPCTMETKCYESQKYNFIRIYDTRGIEISKNFDIDKVFKETLKEIKAKCEKNEPDDLIHCLLYCFTGTRFEKEEGEILVKLRKTYEGKNYLKLLIK